MGTVEKTRFPYNPTSPYQLYTALYASRVAEAAHTNPPVLSIVESCNLYPGSILRRNTEYMEVYFCGPLTSAGAIRATEDRSAAFQQNVKVAETVSEALFPALQMEAADMRLHLTVPGHIGVRAFAEDELKWGEGDYNLFWLMYLSGIDPVSARRFSTSQNVREAVAFINKKDKPRDSYKNTYQNLVDAFIAFVHNPQSGTRLNKLSKMVVLPDFQNSFGSQMEVRLAAGIGIPVEEVQFNQKWIEQQNHLWFNSSHSPAELDGSPFHLSYSDTAETAALQRIF
jgi:hypothetical protein